LARPQVYTGFAAAAPGTEDLVEVELRGLGLKEVEIIPGGVSFKGDAADLFRVNLYSRVAGRVLVRAARFFAGGFQEFERRIKRVEWGAWLPAGQAVRVRVVAAKTKMNHTGRLEELVLGAIHGQLGEVAKAGAPSSGKGQLPPLEVYLRVRREKVTVSIDTSGEHLHRRGYRTFAGEAPLRENLAAACLMSLGYDGTAPLVDPCCGSGTFAVEAALIATGTAPGLFRGFAFERLPLFDAGAWDALRREALKRSSKGGHAPIYGSDIDPEAVALAARAAKEAGVGESVQLSVAPMEELVLPGMDQPGVLVANPPYGLRLKGEARAYRALHDMLKGSFAGWRWGVIVCLKKEAAHFALQGDESRRFIGAGLPLEFRTGGQLP
jgi:putative N6-adenine-specific DNA methylase